ncbi:hypothetical protein [Nannocystis radixulma]|uniref:Uncharacterized protein n=1 Tax=Nannocystis radixulma TaxID=2995305 RepID=A0ABT5B7M9_9BACT|nr:hypothetical protein [Nannocystis radixulma]MDC0670112.1 hypothetical protein [Nannocystis radixulma]
MFFRRRSKHQQRFTQASLRLSVAETELTAAMAELGRTERADKQIASERLRVALAELVTARAFLAACAVAV